MRSLLHLLVIFTFLLLPMVYQGTAYADDNQKPVAHDTDVNKAKDTQGKSDQGEKDKEDIDEEDDGIVWKSDGIDFIINTFKLEYSMSSSASDSNSRERHNTSLMSVSSIGIRSYHGRKIIGFGIGTPFASGALQVPSSGAFHFGYQLNDNWQIGALAFIDFSLKVYSEDETNLDGPSEGMPRIMRIGADYDSSSISTALGGWLEYRFFDWWNLQLVLYQVRSVVRSAVIRSYEGLSDDFEEAESGVEYIRMNFSLSRRFKLSSNLELAPKVLVGFNTLYDRDYRYEDVNADTRKLDFEDSKGFYMSVTLGSFIYHL